MLICVPSLDMILKFCTVVTSALLQLLYLGGKVNLSIWLIKVCAHICWVGSIAGLDAWRGEMFAPSWIFTMISKAIYNFDHTRLQFFTQYYHEVRNEKVLLLQNIIYFSSKSNVKSMHILEFFHCTHILDTISSGTRFPVV